MSTCPKERDRQSGADVEEDEGGNLGSQSVLNVLGGARMHYSDFLALLCECLVDCQTHQLGHISRPVLLLQVLGLTPQWAKI